MTRILMGEFIGCIFLILFGGGVVANNLLTKSKGQNAGWMTICAGWGFGVMIAVFVAQSVGSSQADLNPAVTLAKYLLGMYGSFIQVFYIWMSQILGCFIGATFVWLFYYPHWKETEDTALKLAVFATGPAIRMWPANLLAEMIGTSVLIFCIGGIFDKSVHGDMIYGWGPYLVGLLVWSIGLSLGGPTGYAINPARDFGPRMAHALLPISGKGKSDWSYAWVPVVGPFLGASVSVLLWKILFK